MFSIREQGRVRASVAQQWLDAPDIASLELEHDDCEPTFEEEMAALVAAETAMVGGDLLAAGLL